MEWISVKERMPEAGHTVEIMHNGTWPEVHRVMHTGNAIVDGGEVQVVPNVGYTGYFRKDTVTHWRYREPALAEAE